MPRTGHKSQYAIGLIRGLTQPVTDAIDIGSLDFGDLPGAEPSADKPLDQTFIRGHTPGLLSSSRMLFEVSIAKLCDR